MLKLYKANSNRFGGVIYTIEVRDSYYAGLSERPYEVRFKEHIKDALRGYYITDGNIDEAGYTKLHQSIVRVLESSGYDIKETYKYIKSLSLLRQYEKRKRLLEKIFIDFSPFIKPHIIEIHFGGRVLCEREALYIDEFPVKDLYENKILELDFHEDIDAEYIDLKKDGLNTLPGGMSASGISLPLYDIAIMIAVGLSAPQISEILINNYCIPVGKIRTVQEKIDNFFGGSYLAQEKFLRPIIEHLDSRGISRNEIYLRFKNAELMNGCFLEWSYGLEFLEGDIENICEIFTLELESDWEKVEELLEQNAQYYAGYSKEVWLRWIARGFSKKDIANKINIGKQKVKKIFKKFIKIMKLKIILDY
ncbi:MAG: hypothetical protein R6U96_18980 [Promethearchaeia archaeon]